MPGNSAGIVRAHRTITLIAGQDTYTLPAMYASGVAPTATFIYPNDRYLLADVAGFTRFTFSVGATGTVTTPSVTFYYTNDPGTAAGLKSFSATGLWTIMAAPSEQTGTGSVTNPVTATDGSAYMQFTAPLLAYRIVTNGFAGGGSVIVNMVATP
jgi:hypothetical protein